MVSSDIAPDFLESVFLLLLACTFKAHYFDIRHFELFSLIVPLCLAKNGNASIGKGVRQFDQLNVPN